MIPTRDHCYVLSDKFKLPTQKKIHVEEVAKLANYFVKKFAVDSSCLPAGKARVSVDAKLVEAAALLHDIDKNVTKRPGERHPDTAVRILNELGFTEVAEVVRRHSLHAILDPRLAPRTWEEKIVYLADKMTKYEIIGVDHRFKLWYRENLPADAVKQLDASFPKVKALEQEIYQVGKINFTDIQKELQYSNT